jgi:hypothetical protein
MANHTITVIVTDVDMVTLEELARLGHSYPSTVARFLLAEKISDKRKESGVAAEESTVSESGEDDTSV